MSEPKVSAIAPWFGSNRMLAQSVGDQLAGCEWVGIPFMGGGSELFTIKARTIVANDLHRLVVNLALVMSHPLHGPSLYRRLRRMTFHPDMLSLAQSICIGAMDSDPRLLNDDGSVNLAEAYFITCWMGRSAKAGTETEFDGGLPVRWSAGGGDSAVRFQSAVSSIPAFRRFLRRCNFTSKDCFEFIGQCQDKPKHGIYVDAPWPELGHPYRHKFDTDKQEKLAGYLAEFHKARVVIRFGDHPLIRELYPESEGWHWIYQQGRKQSNGLHDEVLITNQAPARP
jgi:DNA adenine methylase